MPAPPQTDPAGAGLDLWQLAGASGGLMLASYLTTGTSTAWQYRMIVDVLLEQQQHTLTASRTRTWPV